MEGGDHDIAALHREPEALLRVPARIVQATLVGRDQPDAAEAPRRVEILALARVGLQCGLGHVACLAPRPSIDKKAGQLDEIERVVTARPGLYPDQLAGHLDRVVEIVRQPSEAERAAVSAFVLP